MSDEEIMKKITSVVVDKLNAKEDQVKPEADFVNDLKADSLDRTELVMGLEEEFGIEIPDTESSKLKTVGDVFAYVKAAKA
jgi:acyl carrier protein